MIASISDDESILFFIVVLDKIDDQEFQNAALDDFDLIVGPQIDEFGNVLHKPDQILEYNRVFLLLIYKTYAEEGICELCKVDQLIFVDENFVISD